MSLDATVTGIIKRADGTVLLTLQNSDGGCDGLLRVENPDSELDRLLNQRIWGCVNYVRCGEGVIADRYVQAIRLRSRWWAAIEIPKLKPRNNK